MTFQLKTTGEECRKIKNMQGEVSDFCERLGLIANMETSNYFKNRWLDFVFQMDMRKDKEFTRFWVNQWLIGVIKGDLSPKGEFLGFKFGPNRNSIKKPPQVEVIYYTDIMRGASCEDLEILNCEQFSRTPSNNSIYGARELVRCLREPEQGMPCPLI